MTPKQLIAHFGSKKEAAYKIDYSEPGIQVWINQNKIPAKAQRLIESVTNGALKSTRGRK